MRSRSLLYLCITLVVVTSTHTLPQPRPSREGSVTIPLERITPQTAIGYAKALCGRYFLSGTALKGGPAILILIRAPEPQSQARFVLQTLPLDLIPEGRLFFRKDERLQVPTVTYSQPSGPSRPVTIIALSSGELKLSPCLKDVKAD